MKAFIKYPGGKSRMVGPILERIPKDSNFTDVFTGGGSISIAYARENPLSHIYMNDLDAFTFSMWDVMVNGSDSDLDRLYDLIRQTPTIDLFNLNRSKINTNDSIERAYYCVFFHKTTFSGMFHAGPIGGKGQKSKWTVGCHYNADNIIKKMRFIRTLLLGRTTVTNSNFSDVNFIGSVYLDPPYIDLGDQLYSVIMSEEEHRRLAEKISIYSGRWLLSYAEHPIVYELYKNFKIEKYNHTMSMTSFTEGGKCKVKVELLISNT